MDAGIGQAGATPADLLHQEGTDRPTHRAGEAPKQRDMGDGAAGLFPVQAPERGEGRIVETSPHSHPKHQPADNEHWQGRSKTQHQQAGREQQRTGDQHRPATMMVDQVTYAR